MMRITRQLWALLVALLLLIPAGAGFADCSNIAPYLAVERVLAPHLLAQEDLSLMERAAIGRVLAQVKQAHRRSDWTQADLAVLDPPLNRLLAGSARYVERGFVADHRALANELRQVVWFLVGRCRLDTEAILVLRNTEGTVLGGAPFKDNDQTDPPLARVAAGIGISLVALVACIGAAFGVKRLGDLAYSYRFNRKSCRVRCDILLDRHRFDGLVTVLGLKGCRVEIAPEVDMNAFYNAILKYPPEIACRDIVMPVKVFALYDAEMGLLFDAPLGLSFQAEILEHSTSAPHYVEPKRLGANFNPMAFDPPRAPYRRATVPINAPQDMAFGAAKT